MFGHMRSERQDRAAFRQQLAHLAPHFARAVQHTQPAARRTADADVDRQGRWNRRGECGALRLPAAKYAGSEQRPY